jgi:hypothetical protein
MGHFAVTNIKYICATIFIFKDYESSVAHFIIAIIKLFIIDLISKAI